MKNFVYMELKIYTLSSTRDINNIRYVGKTKQKLNRRLCQHLSAAKKAKKDKIKHMVICYQGLEKDGFVFNGTAPMATKEFKLYETLIVYTNEVKNLNNKISFMDYSNKAVYNLDITKKVCRIFDINKI